MNADLLEPGNDRWLQVLRGTRHEFYHLPTYVQLEARRMGGEPRALCVYDDDGCLLVPLVLRRLEAESGRPGAPGLADATSPYGYPGPLVVARDGDPGRFIARAMAKAGPVLEEAGVISAFIRLNPVLNRGGDFAETGSVVEHGPTVWIDLTLSDEELHRHLRPRYRSYIGAAQRNGLTARFDVSWTHFESFVRLYHSTMDRVHAADWYYFDRDYFEQMRLILGEDLKLCVVEDGGRLVSAGLFSVSGGIVQYLLSGTDVNAGHPHASKLMMIHVRDWAKRAGHSVFHLGGGLGGQTDHLTTFKRGFSKLTLPFLSWRLVFDDPAYEKVTLGWEKHSGESADGRDGFFPAYRKPLPAKSST